MVVTRKFTGQRQSARQYWDVLLVTYSIACNIVVSKGSYQGAEKCIIVLNIDRLDGFSEAFEFS